MAILALDPQSGTHTNIATLELARTQATYANKTIVVTSALTQAQSNITAAWPTDRALKIEKGGSIANSTTFTINSSFSAGLYQVFTGAGTVTGLAEVRPEWWGAKLDGTTDSTAAIQAAVNSFAHGVSTTKGSGRILLSAPKSVAAEFYKITDTITISEVWNISIEAPSLAFADRTGGSGLITWYGAINKPMFLLGDFSYAVNTKNLYLDGRNIVGVVGFQIGNTAGGYPETAAVNHTHENLHVRNCDVGVKVGDRSDTGGDFSKIMLVNCRLQDNKSIGLQVASTNAIVTASGLTCIGNGYAPTGTQKGANVYLGAGMLFLNGYISEGKDATKPVDGDIYQQNGGIQVYGAWSDTHGYFLNSQFASSQAAASIISGVRHYEGFMTGTNTPKSINWTGPNPLVLTGCQLYNTVDVVAGQGGRVINNGTRFIATGATFAGAGITGAGAGYVGLGTSDSPMLAVGRPFGKIPAAAINVTPPQAITSDNYVVGLTRTTGATTLTETLMDDNHSYELVFNGVSSLGAYSSIAAGKVAKFWLDPEKGMGFAYNTAAGANAAINPHSTAGLPVYANNAAALAGGLLVGAFYRTNADPDPICIVH